MRDEHSPVSNVIEPVVDQFLSRTLPKSLWTHEAHLRVGLWHGLSCDGLEAMKLLRDRIRAYNESVGTANTETSGYHETITRFYVRVIEHFLLTADRNAPFAELATQLLTVYGQRELPLQYYSRELLFSTQARLHWVEPDLKPLP